MPKQIKVDNGLPFGNGGSDLPPQLAMWLISLGIEMVWNPPRTPQANGIVENIQGISERWSEPGKCKDLDSLQEHLDQVAYYQREKFRSATLKGKTRREAFEDLSLKPRPYTGEIDLDKICQYFQGKQFQRTVSKNGQIHFLGQRFTIGRKHRGKEIEVVLATTPTKWRVISKEGVELATIEETQLTIENVQKLQFPFNSRRARLHDNAT